ncbi:Carnitine O-acetyltransferase mitochondrial [Coemansia spiralis]|uniref:Carnitine O-acetyltransferase, mitochondrial n=2 Tax=Coemansia TaxID=4863 RepID=A0A9W8L0M9_9FUNG|nr:carnitine acetyl transferase [Coemansia spiralis]KAJ1988386.1 Carnitine O-acetyltransferase mitochondrial [Coemansia umbellata]KAJ2621087.1 Carnitine O-acetyltransferase mitochondrial [Coemansia sp. RSA 1358]KAJ2680199.1 Carnitine O-acetyltransferase mitochondrial [Coemansia spiralis]
MPTSTRSPDHEYGKLFEYQSQLPKLPVPDLNLTLAKYAESLEPLLSADRLAYSKRIIDEFGKSEMGRELQRRLEARAADTSIPNWLEGWWNELSYMGYRDPVIPYVSYHYSFNNDPECIRPNQRAAKLICGALAFRKMLVDGSLQPEMLKDTPLCSHSYKFMFNACRIPRKPADYCRMVEYNGNETVVVVRNGQFFSFAFVRDGMQLRMDEIEATLDQIVAVADSNAAIPVGILTADNRDSWAENRQLLLQASPINAAALDAIESSAFILSLENDMPVTREEFSHAIWHSNGHNRWFDKPCQFVVCDNARAGFCGEHSMMDGTPTLRLVEYVIGYKHEEPESNRMLRGAVFKQLKFATPPAVIGAVKKADAVFIEGIKKQHLKVLNFAAYGKEQIKKLGCSPDAYIQMVIQLAYTRLHNGARPTYEASMTRKFRHGRTETCRSVSNESTTWCRAMGNMSVDLEERVRLFRLALVKHTQLTREAVEAKGVDRHLLGLRMVLRSGEKKPEIFEDPAYSYSSHWYLSTSQISSENFTSYGWSEVTPKGYGIAYNIRKESLLIHITCMRNEYGLDSDHFAQAFETAAMDVRSMLLSEQQKKQ